MRLIMVSNHAANPRVMDMVHVRCKQWSCPYCAPANAQKWKNHLLTTLSRHDMQSLNWVMLTITAHPNAHKAGPIYTIKNILRAWPRLYARLKRYNGGGFEYVRIFEKHPNGDYLGYHVHIVCSIGDAIARHNAEFEEVIARENRARAAKKKPRKRLKREKAPIRWLKDNCVQLGLGHEVDITGIGRNPQKTALYMTKYVTKQFELMEFPHKARRIQTSRHLAPKKRPNTGNVRKWRAKSAIFREDVLRMEKIIDLTAKHIITIEDDFSNGELWYPSTLI